MEKLTQKELDEIIELHKDWLETKGRKGKQAIIVDKDLSGLKIDHARLEMSEIRDSNLSNMKISIICFSGSKFNDVDMSNTALYKCTIHVASLSNVNINNTCFCLTSLDSSWLTEGTDISKACFQGSSLDRTKLDKTYYRISNCCKENSSVIYCIEDKLISNGFCNNGKFVTLDEFKQWYNQKYCGNNSDNRVNVIDPDNYKKLKAYYGLCIKCLEEMEKAADK